MRRRSCFEWRALRVAVCSRATNSNVVATLPWLNDHAQGPTGFGSARGVCWRYFSVTADRHAAGEDFKGIDCWEVAERRRRFVKRRDALASVDCTRFRGGITDACERAYAAGELKGPTT